MWARVKKLLIRDYQKCHLRIPTPQNKNVKGARYFFLVVYAKDHWSCTFKYKKKRETEVPVLLICHIYGDKEWVLMGSEAKCNESTAITMEMHLRFRSSVQSLYLPHLLESSGVPSVLPMMGFDYCSLFEPSHTFKWWWKDVFHL